MSLSLIPPTKGRSLIFFHFEKTKEVKSFFFLNERAIKETWSLNKLFEMF